MSDVLNQVMTSGQPWAADRAQYALEVQQAVGTGQLSPSEAKEVLADLIDVQKLDEAATDIQLRGYLVFGVSQLIAQLG